MFRVYGPGQLKSPHYIGRETESQRENKNCPSSHSKEMAELKPRERFSDSSSRASSMMSYGLRKPGVIWLTQQGSEKKVVTPPKLCSREHHYGTLYGSIDVGFTL